MNNKTNNNILFNIIITFTTSIYSNNQMIN